MAEGYKFNEKYFQNDNCMENSGNAVETRRRENDKIENMSQVDVHVGETVLDLSYLQLDSVTLEKNLEMVTNNIPENGHFIEKHDVRLLYLHNNRLDYLPESLCVYENLRLIDLSSNQMTELSDTIIEFQHLNTLIARNNFLGEFSLPKKISLLQNLEVLNFSGNLFKTLPREILEVHSLKALYLGGNQIEEIPRDIWKLEKLEVLYLGGNNLRDIPAEMGRLLCLQSLVLCENQLQSLPSTISCLRKLRSLALHKNQLTTLPPEIVTLQGLVELSLRDNPLVVRFVQELMYDPPSLRELAARSMKIFRVPYNEKEMPLNLVHYLKSACRCVNPRCRGVYFDARVEHIKFVDFCGKYRLPLLQYLCSPHCSIQPAVRCSGSDANSSDDDSDVPTSRLKRVLLG